MLRLMLDRHPEVCVPPETWFFPFLMRRAELYGNFATSAQIQQFAKDVAATMSDSARPVAEIFAVSAEQIATAVAEAKATNYAQAFAAFMSCLARREGKRTWGEKTPFYSAFLLILARCYPKARFVCLVRDPRDVVFSIHKTPWGRKSYPSLVDGAMRWRYAIEGIEEGLRELGPSRVLGIRYEDLVREPESWTHKICAFLDLTFDERMLRFHETASRRVPAASQQWQEATGQPISKSRVGRWRQSYSPQQVGLIELACGEGMSRWGYAPEGKPRTLLNLSRLKLWKARRHLGRVPWTWLLTPRPPIVSL